MLTIVHVPGITTVVNCLITFSRIFFGTTTIGQ